MDGSMRRLASGGLAVPSGHGVHGTVLDAADAPCSFLPPPAFAVFLMRGKGASGVGVCN